MFGYLLGLMPSARGLFALLVAGVAGEWILGRWGASVPLAMAAAAFIRPRLSMWLESVLFALRLLGFAGAALQFVVTPFMTGRVQNVPLGMLMLAMGIAAYFRIRALLRADEICPAALGTRGRK